MPQAKTIKQAKAAYKNRTEQPLTEREQKQLERAVQLDRRAWGIREREKNKLDLAKKRAAQEKAQKEEERKIGTQRRNDKFGFKSSQYHLGAFFRKPGAAPLPKVMEGNIDAVQSGVKDKAVEPVTEHRSDQDEDEFEDVDDETLLEALQSPEVTRAVMTHSDSQIKPDIKMPPPPRPAFLPTPRGAPLQTPAQAEQDFEWHDFLESSTQIARDIGKEKSASHEQAPKVKGTKEALRTGSFSSGSFELTEDDIEQLDPTPCIRKENWKGAEPNKAATERMEMPPPPIPLKKRGPQQMAENSKCASRSTNLVEPIHKPDDLGFSLSQLEDFMEDDLQLTQAG